MLIHMSPNIDTHESTSVSTNKKFMSEDNKNRVLDNVTIVSTTTVRLTIAHEMANTKAVLQAILVQILTAALKLVFCQIQIQYIGILIGAPRRVFINTPSVHKQISPNPFPKFPISQKDPSPSGLALFGEIGEWLEVQISQFPNFPKDLSPSDSALFGKLGNGYRYILPNFPKDPSPDGPARFGKLGNGEMA